MCRHPSFFLSYDVTLGRYYFRESDPEPGMGIYNPYSQSHVARVWGTVKEAELASEWMERTGTTTHHNTANTPATLTHFTH